jgi:hypothetical protein
VDLVPGWAEVVIEVAFLEKRVLRRGIISIFEAGIRADVTAQRFAHIGVGTADILNAELAFVGGMAKDINAGRSPRDGTRDPIECELIGTSQPCFGHGTACSIESPTGIRYDVSRVI